MDPMEVKAITIQNWWRRLYESRCSTCPSFYDDHEWVCAECVVRNFEDYFSDDDPIIINANKIRAEEKRKRQEKKRALGLIP